MEQKKLKNNRLDLAGQQYGILTVMQSSENIGIRTAWLCQCDCGSTTIVKTVDLRRGKVTSCGCRKKTNGLLQMQYIDGTCIEMLKSTKIRSNNKSGYPGVFYDSKSSKWRAEIMFQGKRYCLGRFNNIIDAIANREEAKEKLHNQFVRKHCNCQDERNTMEENKSEKNR